MSNDTVQVPRGIVKLPLTLNEADTNVTLTVNTASVETTIVSARVPRKAAWSFRKGDVFAIDVSTSGGTRITSGTIRLYITDASKKNVKNAVLEIPLGRVNTGGTTADIADIQRLFHLPAGFSRSADEYILVTLESATACATAYTKLVLEGIQFIET
jgi:hypothetical protein